jgi:hypothetical protein
MSDKNKIHQPPEPYLGQREIDAVMRMNTSLLAEIWQLRDRLAVTEKLLENKAILSSAQIDQFAPDAELAAELEQLRAIMIDRVVNSYNDGGYSVQSLTAVVNARNGGKP